MNGPRRHVFTITATAVVFLLAAQLVPYGRKHERFAVIAEPPWDSAATRSLVKRACFDCHSFETVWPWYSPVAPASWLVYSDVSEGRENLNFSTWGSGKSKHENWSDIRKEVEEGDMPPVRYRMAHPESRFSAVERKAFLEGLRKTLEHR